MSEATKDPRTGSGNPGPSPHSEPIRRVYKYATGDPIPPGATYLSTVTQTERESVYTGKTTWVRCWLVWHYFLIEEEPKQP